MAGIDMDSSASYTAEGDGRPDMGEPVRQSAEEALDGLRKNAEQYLGLGREKALALAEMVEEQIRRRPVPALSVAAGIGFVLGLVWSRRS